MSSRGPEPCDVPRNDHAGRVRPYVNGPKCDAHSPWAAKSQEEPQPAPVNLPNAWTTPSPISDSRVHDARAIASGKRRSSPEVFRAAQAAVGQRTPGLHVDPGQQDAHGRWIRVPAADYLCSACRETESASGDQVARFAARIETEHTTRCSANQQGAPTT